MSPPPFDGPGRTLAYLADVPVDRVPTVAGKRAQLLRKGGIETVADLILHVPRRYIDRSSSVRIADLPRDTEVTVLVEVISVSKRRPRRNLVMIDAVLTDGSGRLKATWFNQPFREHQLQPGAEVALSGKIEWFRGSPQMKSPAVDLLGGKESLVTGRIVPIHPTVQEVSAGHLRRAIYEALEVARPISDPVPDVVLAELGLMERDAAFGGIHFPQSLDQVASSRRRLAFDELFRLEVALAAQQRHRRETSRGIVHDTGGALATHFVDHLPFRLTAAQVRAMEEIEADLASADPMHRLLQGEVGSGKTVVAVATLLAGVEGGYQGAVMAPTEVLAGQHFLSITGLLDLAGMTPEIEGDESRLGMESLFAGPSGESGAGPVVVALLTGSSAEVTSRPRGGVRRQDLLDMISAGQVDLVIGTHALIQEGVHFHRLGVAVVDEQHRFGVHQRVNLKEKAGDVDPDLLIMTATPIPRTLAMTLYGDLDVTLLDAMPPGRAVVSTVHLGKGPVDWAGVERLIRQQAAEGRQAFVVCPLVEDSPKVEAASATTEHKRLQQVLTGLRVGLIHGQMPSVEKETVMRATREGDLDVLVATTVIEVGIDIPNATVMVIEDADRFGLSQLHQLRGRVGRAGFPSTCVLMSEPTTDEGEQRVAAMVTSTDGFVLAEEDLRIRGQGTVFGARQSGLPDLRLADILRDADLLVTARREAFRLVGADPQLDNNPELKDEVTAFLGEDVQWLFKS
jgi:ATP-dependent DNA helicase RecG